MTHQESIDVTKTGPLLIQLFKNHLLLMLFLIPSLGLVSLASFQLHSFVSTLRDFVGENFGQYTFAASCFATIFANGFFLCSKTAEWQKVFNPLRESILSLCLGFTLITLPGNILNGLHPEANFDWLPIWLCIAMIALHALGTHLFEKDLKPKGIIEAGIFMLFLPILLTLFVFMFWFS